MSGPLQDDREQLLAQYRRTHELNVASATRDDRSRLAKVGSRLGKLYRDEGRWVAYVIINLAINRIKLIAIRFLLDNRTVYFQAAPRILGRRYISFGPGFNCGKGAWIEAIREHDEDDRTRIVIGRDVSVSDYFHVAACMKVDIGDNVLIGSGVLITDHAHGAYGVTGTDPNIAPNARPLHIKGEVKLGRNVWLGDGVRVLSGVTIGDNSVIAANTVVRENVPANCVYGGLGSARVIRVYDSAEAGWKRPENMP